MIRAVIDCDGCHARDVSEAQLLYVTLADSEDGAPGSAGIRWDGPARRRPGVDRPPPRLQRVDLCPKCLAAALSRLVSRLDPEARRDWVRQYAAEEPSA
jgi:hypothetical protein